MLCPFGESFLKNLQMSESSSLRLQEQKEFVSEKYLHLNLEQGGGLTSRVLRAQTFDSKNCCE